MFRTVLLAVPAGVAATRSRIQNVIADFREKQVDNDFHTAGERLRADLDAQLARASADSGKNLKWTEVESIVVGSSFPGKTYFQKRLSEGDSRQRALRSLKRRLARVVFVRLRTEHRSG